MAQRRDVDILAQLFQGARHRLLQTITGKTGAGTKTFANTILQQLQGELKKLKAVSTRFVETRIPREYKRELDGVYSYFTKNNLRMKAPENFADLHTEAIQVIADEMQYQVDDALSRVGRQVTRYVENAQDEALRQAGLRQAGLKEASGGTVQDMQQHMVQDLQEQGFMTVQYGEGPDARQVPIDAYVEMVARSTTREAGNTARINQLTANGYDHMEITEHTVTCEVCSALQGRVYSISGKDTRFPPLSRAVGKYNNIHPNCRHSIVPWIEELQTPEEIAAAIEKSNRPFEDTRSAQDIAIYNRQQAENRQAREIVRQYERYKARLGEDAPKTLGAFNRLKKQGGEKWEALQDKYRNGLYQQSYDDIMKTHGRLSNQQARRWYIYHDSTIKAQINPAAPLEDRARQAHGLRNLYRQQTRDLMKDREAASWLETNNPNISFEEMLTDKMIRKNLSREESMLDIIETSQKTNKEVNEKLSIE